ncbi:hypothetical protein [Propionibacterium ruminifibrarum]|nr:hypothetical protein [Propionibacterium ruminifibrarum]
MTTLVDVLMIVLMSAAAVAAGGLFWLGRRQSHRGRGGDGT